MVNNDRAATTTPIFSVIIAAYNDWAPLDRCLTSLSDQTSGPSFEVIIVDDGSRHPIPQPLLNRSYPVTLIRQSHAGIPAARNSGVKASQGSILLFVDADCNVQPGCLAILDSTIASNPQQNSFQ
ncbi:MAG: glycosyltransferase family 2 protein, partial [Acidobacteriaceae bacterium]|nr:glycosyltransferase family 2 protein [Acidobacteriaceae bacterium]